MKIPLQKTCSLILLFFAWGFARAAYTGTVTGSTGCGPAGSIVITQLNTFGTAPFTVTVYDSIRGYSYTYFAVSGPEDTITGLSTGSYRVSFFSNSNPSDTVSLNTYVVATVLNIDTGTVVNVCNSYYNGSIAVHVSNGASPFNYHWGSGVNDSIISHLTDGLYSLTVTDTNGCTGSFSYYLGYNSLGFSLNPRAPTCLHSDGTLTTVFDYGGTGSGRYNYLWSNGESTAIASNLAAGFYMETVTDLVSGCTATASYRLTAWANYDVNVVTMPTACDTTLAIGSATAFISGTGGTAPYYFQWFNYSPGHYPTFIGSGQTISALPYNIQVYVVASDSNDCVAELVNPGVNTVISDPACFDHITGYVFLDSNRNCILDAGEQGMNLTNVSATDTNGQVYYANADNSGFYDIAVLQGIYTVQASLSAYGGLCYTNSCNSSYTDTFITSGLVSAGNNFSMTPSGSFNLSVIPGCTAGAPGGTKQYWIYYANSGASPANNAVVTFIHDPSLTLLSTNPSYSNYNSSNHTITWNLGTVPYTAWTQITMLFNVSPTDSLGSMLFAQAEIDPISGDCNPIDNISNISNIVSGSHDPNFKEVSPAGNLSAADTVLTYTIHFQNDGNAPANTIIIKDTLSPNVNPATVVPGASSFPGYQFSLSGHGIMTFTFEGINLPDTSHGSSSEGFVTYTVHTKPNLPLGTEISNTAFIYFDINPAVVTNTTNNERSDIASSIRNINGSTMTVRIAPNPAHGQTLMEFRDATGSMEVSITDPLGSIIAAFTTSIKTYILDADALASGVYFYTARDSSGHLASGKISVVR
jgi:uncharacterized repeat protein (TIGR01451 family)